MAEAEEPVQAATVASPTVPATSSSASNKKLHIKGLHISGFRSYSDAKVTNLSAKHNCIVGPNGSGKSNFFAALEFVLGEREFSNLSHEDRQKLLHEGGQDDSALMAYVEVTFDNSDGRLPLDTDEVKLRRSVGLKKDEFFLNNKHVSKTDVVNLLESAGFSRSNPYYICRQGKVAELCTMSDAQRLNLLKEVAGTTVYDLRRKDSEKLLEEAHKKTTQINESIASITTRLNELQQEKEELEQFRELDRERRSLDYLLNSGDLQESERKLDAIEQERQKLIAEAQQRVAIFDKLSEEVESCEQSVTSMQDDLARLESERKVANNNLTALSKVRTRRELDVRDLEERLRVRAQKMAESKAELSKVEDEIAEIEETLDRPEGADKDQDGLRLRMERARAALTKCRETIKRLESREDELRSKQGRTARFGDNLAKRNEWIDQEIASLKTTIESRNRAHEEFEQQCKEMNEEKQRVEKALQEQEASSGELEDGKARAMAGLQKAREAKDQATVRKKELWRDADKHEEAVRQATEELKRAQRAMSEIVPVAFDQGVRALDDICQAKGIDRSKVFGSLLSLIRCDNPNFRTAVEVAAGNQLLHVVVDSDETAAKLMEGLLAKRAGRLTFKPLNVLAQRERQMAQARQTSRRGAATEEDDDDDEGPAGGDVQELVNSLGNDPEVKADDAIPLITRISYDEKFAPAVRAMLGKTLLCRNHRVASICAKKYKVDCVTLDGDQVSRRGALSGGFVDNRRSRLAASEDIKTATQKLNEGSRLCEEAKTNMRREEQEVARFAGEMEKFQSTIRQLEQTQRNLAQEKARLGKSQRVIRDRLAELEEKKSSFAPPTELTERIKELQEEKRQPPLSALKDEEKAELLAIPKQLEDLRQQEKELGQKEEALSSKVMQLKSNLEENLLRRRDELLATIQQSAMSSTAAGATSSQDEGTGAEGNMMAGSISLDSAKMDLDAIKQEEQEAKAALDALDGKVERTKKEVAESMARLDALRSKLPAASENRDKADAEVEKVLGNRRVFLAERDKAAKKIRELGRMEAAELEKYRQLSKKELTTKLQKITNSLKKFSAVNKRALDQFVTFSEKRQALVQRQKEARDADDKIRDLIEHLDRAKDEAIRLTFKHVAHNFREIFSELVPDGVAQLRMVKARSEDGSDEEGEAETEEAKASGKVSSFAGVSPRVSFSGSKDTVPMKSLSGGQKALVALTLIFAIQRCDPAPFYLFDEIDQALDQSHRTAVAALIQRQTRSKTRSAQFITTTFRPELVEVADKCFGIQFSNKVSSVGLIDKDQALKFIRMAQSDPRTQQQVAESRRAMEAPANEDENAGGEEESLSSGPEDEPQDDVQLSASAKRKKSAAGATKKVTPTVSSESARARKKRRASGRGEEDDDDDE